MQPLDQIVFPDRLLAQWLATAETFSAVEALTATVSVHFATLHLGLGSLGSGSSGLAVSLLRRACTLLHGLAVEHGMLSTERWPCLAQAADGVDSDALAALSNIYLPPLEPPTRAPPGRDAGHVSVDEDEELAVPDNKAIDWLVVGAPSHMRG